MSKQKRILLGMRATDSVKTETVLSLMNLISSDNRIAVVDLATAALAFRARNNMCQKALQNDCDGILMLDADQTFPPNILDILLGHKKDIVGFPVARRSMPFSPNITRINPSGYYQTYDDFPQNHIFQVDAIGTGCLYISRNVLDELELPYFFHEISEVGQELGEDVYFCRKAKEAGFKIWVDPQEFIGHVGGDVITIAHYRAYRQMAKQQEQKQGEQNDVSQENVSNVTK